MSNVSQQYYELRRRVQELVSTFDAKDVALQEGALDLVRAVSAEYAMTSMGTYDTTFDQTTLVTMLAQLAGASKDEAESVNSITGAMSTMIGAIQILIANEGDFTQLVTYFQDESNQQNVINGIQAAISLSLAFGEAEIVTIEDLQNFVNTTLAGLKDALEAVPVLGALVDVLIDVAEAAEDAAEVAADVATVGQAIANAISLAMQVQGMFVGNDGIFQRLLAAVTGDDDALKSLFNTLRYQVGALIVDLSHGMTSLENVATGIDNDLDGHSPFFNMYRRPFAEKFSDVIPAWLKPMLATHGLLPEHVFVQLWWPKTSGPNPSYDVLTMSIGDQSGGVDLLKELITAIQRGSLVGQLRELKLPTSQFYVEYAVRTTTAQVISNTFMSEVIWDQAPDGTTISGTSIDVSRATLFRKGPVRLQFPQVYAMFKQMREFCKWEIDNVPLAERTTCYRLIGQNCQTWAERVREAVQKGDTSKFLVFSGCLTNDLGTSFHYNLHTMYYHDVKRQQQSMAILACSPINPASGGTVQGNKLRQGVSSMSTTYGPYSPAANWRLDQLFGTTSTPNTVKKYIADNTKVPDPSQATPYTFIPRNGAILVSSSLMQVSLL